jgi:hypothetical protein
MAEETGEKAAKCMTEILVHVPTPMYGPFHFILISFGEARVDICWQSCLDKI